MAPQALIFLSIPGLSLSLMGERAGQVPAIHSAAREAALRTLIPILAGTSASLSASLLTGLLPQDHGVLGENRRLAKPPFWRRSPWPDDLPFKAWGWPAEGVNNGEDTSPEAPFADHDASLIALRLNALSEAAKCHGLESDEALNAMRETDSLVESAIQWAQARQALLVICGEYALAPTFEATQGAQVHADALIDSPLLHRKAERNTEGHERWSGHAREEIGHNHEGAGDSILFLDQAHGEAKAWPDLRQEDTTLQGALMVRDYSGKRDFQDLKNNIGTLEVSWLCSEWALGLKY